MTQASPQHTIDIGQTLSRAYAHWQAGQADQAEMACQQVLAIWPGQSDAMHLMGLMAHAYGNLDLAIAHLRRACQAPRAPAIYFSDLAEMCRQRGLLAEGEQAARRAVALNPNLPGAWNNLGIILQESLKLDESRLCLQRVLALQPDNPAAHNNLGNTCKRLGLLDQAEQCWTRALALRPNYPEAYSNLANLLIDQGEYDRAADYARRAIELGPQFADAYINLAGVETARQHYGEALRWLNALLAFAPMHAGGLAAQALTLKQLDQLDAALNAAQMAVAAAPENPDAYNALGQVEQALGRLDQALAAYHRASTLPGTALETSLLNRATLLVEFGRTAAAQAAFNAVTEAFPNSVQGWAAQIDLRRVAANDPVIARLQALLVGDGKRSLSDRMTLHFALGKAFLDIGDSREAFRHLDEGNRLKRANFAYDPNATSRWMAAIAATFTAVLLEAKAGGGDPSDLPVFVLGMPRSGTTLIEQILASHPEVYGAGELRQVQVVVDEIGAFPDAVPDLSPERLRQLGAAYLARVMPLASGHRHVLDKMPSNFFYAGLIRLILPRARIIHCRRDPVDTCLSCYTKLFGGEQAFAYDMMELGRFHRDYQMLMSHWRTVLPATHFLEVDYEAVVDDLEAETRRMLAFLGLPWNDACLRFHETERPVRTASVNQVRQPLYRSSAGRWRAHAAQLGPLLKALGVAHE